MASFEKQSSQNGEAGATQVQKFPIKRLQVSVKKFVKVLEIDLDRLERHRQNIERLSIQENWILLNKEQVNASRTVQQIKANVREIEKARGQVIEEDLHLFDDSIEDVKFKAVRAISDFLIVSHSGSSSPTDEVVVDPALEVSNSPSCTSSEYGTSYHPPHYINRPTISTSDIISCSLPNSSEMSQTQLTNIRTINPETVASWQHLQEDLVDLNTMIHDYTAIVQEQGEKVDRIEDNISNAEAEVKAGTSYLGQASKYKAAIFPVAGAVIGGALGGPIGLIAGIKLGSITALSGGVAGFLGGKLWKKRQDKVTELELSNLSVTRSTSLSDIPSSTPTETS